MEETNYYDQKTDASFPNDNSHGWQKVISKCHKNQPKQNNKPRQNGSLAGGATETGDDANAFRAIEEQLTNQRRRVLEAQRAADEADLPVRKVRSKDRHGYDSDEEYESEVEDGKENAVSEENKKKEKKEKKAKKKEKKPKVTIAEAAAKIVPDDEQ